MRRCCRRSRRASEFDWNDFLAGPKKAATYDGKLCGLPYRITTGIFHYQKELLEKAGFSKPPETCESSLRPRMAVNTPPDRYAFGMLGMQGAGIYASFAPGCIPTADGFIDFKTGEIFINDAKAVEALQF